MISADDRLIATRYAAALFEMSAPAKAHDAVLADLESLAKLDRESPEFHTFITSPLVTRGAAQGAMQAIAEKGKANKVTAQFLATLSANRRLDLLPAITELFAQQLGESRGELTAEVESATPLPADLQKQVSESLAKATGKKIKLKLRENAALIGGLVVYFAGKRLDLSVAGSLGRLQQSLRAE